MKQNDALSLEPKRDQIEPEAVQEATIVVLYDPQDRLLHCSFGKVKRNVAPECS